MNKAVLITRPCYDDATSYCFYYAGMIVKEAESRGIIVYDLKRPRLTLDNFRNIIEGKEPSFLFFNAHGDKKTIYGDRALEKEEILIQENKNHNLLDSKLVYARTCLVGASLGKACKGGCFIGYNVPFSFYVDARWSTKPANDTTAELFFGPSNLIVSSLLKGNTAQDAVNKSHAMTKKTMLRLLKEKEEPGTMASLSLLWSNMQGTVVLGNKSMSFD